MFIFGCCEFECEQQQQQQDLASEREEGFAAAVALHQKGGVGLLAGFGGEQF